jgi:hypothetical protein
MADLETEHQKFLARSDWALAPQAVLTPET